MTTLRPSTARPRRRIRDAESAQQIIARRRAGAEARVASPALRVVPAVDSGPLLYDGQAADPSRRRDTVRRRLLALADLVAVLGAFGTMWALLAPTVHAGAALGVAALLPLWIVLNKALRLYDRDANLIHKSTLNEIPSIAQSVTIGSAALFMVAAPVFGVGIERAEIAVFWVTAMVLVPALRSAVRRRLTLRLDPERCLLVGSGVVAGIVARKVTGHKEYGSEVVGYVDIRAHGDVNGELDRLGDIDEFEAVCREHHVHRVVVTFSSLAHERLLDIIRISKRLGIKITIVPRLFEVIGHGVEIDQIEGMTLLGLRGPVRTKSTLFLKRLIDVVGAGSILLLTAPLLVLIALAVKLTSRGPALFVQRRVGRGHKQFGMYKFRTMVDGADELKTELSHLNELREGPMFKIADDPRVTRVGRFLRRTSLDELPQLFNVLRGDMSLVGPRPLVPEEDDHVIGWHRARLDLTPGLTGPWQVLGRTNIPFSEMVKIDYLYVADWSLWNDIKLLLRTLPVVFQRSGR